MAPEQEVRMNTLRALRGHIRLIVACASLAAFASLTSVASAAQDYGDLTGGFGAELTAAIPVALIAVGLFVGVVMAYKVIRRLLRA
jgi:hypothetical protein